MRKLQLVFLAVFPLIWIQTSTACDVFIPDTNGYRVQGDAYDWDGNLLYSEYLQFQPSETGGKLKVSYSLPDAGEFARKVADFNCQPTTPAFKLTDVSSQNQEGVEWQPDGKSIISFQNGERTELEVPDGITIFDAGFDNTIKRHWDSLVAGEQLKVNYLFARDNRFLTLRIAKSEPPADIDPDSVRDVFFFRISANNLIFRMLSKPLYVGYTPQTRSLAYYIGPSNLPTMRDQKAIVIRYRDLASNAITRN